MKESNYEYFAFISYSWDDEKEAIKLQKKLESYKLPVFLQGKYPELKTHIRPIFRDKTDNSGIYTYGSLFEALSKSRFLIVLCSPRSSKSDWVNNGIKFFLKSGRREDIIPFIIDGQPRSKDFQTEAFPPALLALSKTEDLLGINIADSGLEIAFVKLISRLFDVKFNSLWDRYLIDQRKRRRKIIASIMVTVIVFVFSIYITLTYTQAVDVKVCLNEVSVHNNNLPALQNAKVTLTIDNEIKTDTIVTMEDSALFTHIPHSAIGKEAHILVECTEWQTIDTTVLLTKDLIIDMVRDWHVYGDIQFKIFDTITEKGVPGIKASIAGIEGISDNEGRVHLSIPIETQDTLYYVNCEVPLVENTIKSYLTTESQSLRIQYK